MFWAELYPHTSGLPTLPQQSKKVYRKSRSTEHTVQQRFTQGYTKETNGEWVGWGHKKLQLRTY